MSDADSRGSVFRIREIFAQALDPDDLIQAERRGEVLERTAELLDDAEYEDRYTDEEIAMKQHISNLVRR